MEPFGPALRSSLPGPNQRPRSSRWTGPWVCDWRMVGWFWIYIIQYLRYRKILHIIIIIIIIMSYHKISKNLPPIFLISNNVWIWWSGHPRKTLRWELWRRQWKSRALSAHRICRLHIWSYIQICINIYIYKTLLYDYMNMAIFTIENWYVGG